MFSNYFAWNEPKHKPQYNIKEKINNNKIVIKREINNKEKRHK